MKTTKLNNRELRGLCLSISKLSQMEALAVLNEAKSPEFIPSLNVFAEGQLKDYFGVDGRSIVRIHTRGIYASHEKDCRTEVLSVDEVLKVDMDKIKRECEMFSHNVTGGVDVRIRGCDKRFVIGYHEHCYTPRAVLKCAMLIKNSDTAELIRRVYIKSKFWEDDYKENGIGCCLKWYVAKIERAEEKERIDAELNEIAANKIRPEISEPAYEIAGISPEIIQAMIKAAVESAVESAFKQLKQMKIS